MSNWKMNYTERAQIVNIERKIQVESNADSFKWCICQKEKSMITLLAHIANTWKKFASLKKKIYFEKCQ